jgi:hypothetical protein
MISYYQEANQEDLTSNLENICWIVDSLEMQYAYKRKYF